MTLGLSRNRWYLVLFLAIVTIFSAPASSPAALVGKSIGAVVIWYLVARAVKAGAIAAGKVRQTN